MPEKKESTEKLAEAQAELQKLLNEKEQSVIPLPELMSSGILLAEYYNFVISALQAGKNPDEYDRVGFVSANTEQYPADLITASFAWKLQQDRVTRKLEESIPKIIWRKIEDKWGRGWTEEAAKIAISFGRYSPNEIVPIAVLESIREGQVSLNLGRDVTYIDQAIESLKRKNSN